MSALPPKADILGPPKKKGTGTMAGLPAIASELGVLLPDIKLLAAAEIRTGCELQILFDRVIADRYVNQCSTLKSRDELVVFDRIDRLRSLCGTGTCRPNWGVYSSIARSITGQIVAKEHSGR